MNTDVSGEKYFWYTTAQDILENSINNNLPAGSSSFTWTVPNEDSTWNIMFEAREPNVPEIEVDLSKFAFKVWTIITNQIINVNAGGDIQAAIGSLPASGGSLNWGAEFGLLQKTIM